MGLLDRVMLKKARFENEETPPELLPPTEAEPEVPIDPDADLERKLCWLPETPESKSRVTVVSYNVLGRCNADGMHSKSHPSSLTWSFRRQRLLTEIVSYECDVICLQDVDDYHGFWLPGLNAAGFDTMYAPRQKSQAHAEEDLISEDLDGVLIGWKRMHFQLVRSEVIELHRAAERAKRASTAVRCAARDEIAMILDLVPFNDATHDAALVVCCTQLAGGHAGDQYEPTAEDWDVVSDEQMRELVTNWRAEESVRGTQTKYLTEQIEQFNRDFQHPVVLCCTLHGAPNSEAHALLETGRPLPIPAPPRPPPSPPTLEPDGIGLGDIGESPTTAVLYWLPAVVDASKLDPPVERYYVQHRIGGNTTLGWSKPLILDEHLCTHYTTVLRPGTRKKRTVRDPRYRHVVAGLCSGVAYEFRVAGESSLGLGAYSEPSAPFATKAYGANIPDYYDLDKEAPAPAPESEDPLTVAEDLRQLRVCGPDVPRLLLGPSEVARKHAVGESLSLQHAVAAAREANLVDEAFAREASRAKSAVEQLALLEQVKVALDNGDIDPRLASADHEVRQQARFATTDEALRAQEFADYDQKHHPFSSKTGISPRHNARFATPAYSRTCEQVRALCNCAICGGKIAHPVEAEPTHVSNATAQVCVKRLAISPQRAASEGMSHNRPPPFKMDPKYLTPAAQPHVKERISLDEPETVINKPPEHNRLGLFSAYNQAAGAEPPYTMTAERRVACVDYVFLSKDVLRPVAYLPVPRLRQFAPPPKNEDDESDGEDVIRRVRVARQRRVLFDDATFVREAAKRKHYIAPEDIEDAEKLAAMPEDVFEGAFRAAIDANRGSWLPNDRFPSDHMALVVVFDVDERLTPAVHAA